MSRDDGSATLELAILAPGLIALLSLVIVAGRIEAAAGAVEQAAAAAARAASLSRSPRTAAVRADSAARQSLADQGVTCQPLTSAVDVSGFRIPVGQAASVRAQVSCTVPLADLAVPGMPGTRTISVEMTSPLDRYRGRQ